MDRQKTRRGKAAAAILAAAIFSLSILWVIGLVIWAQICAPTTLWLVLPLLAVLATPLVGAALALAQRLREIESGEEEDASVY